MSVQKKESQKRKAAFLEAFARIGTVTHACRELGIDQSTPYQWVNRDKEFAKKFDDAKKAVAESLEQEAIRRARDGVEEPVFYQGKQTGTIQKYSDTLLIFLLKAWDEKYSDRQKTELSGELKIDFGIPRPDAD